MAYTQNELSGSLFKNDKKETEKHPNATGSALIGGVEYWVSAWTKKDKNGNPWQSLAFKPKTEKTATGGTQRNPGKNEEDADSIPF